jgi:hypothetical protein
MTEFPVAVVEGFDVSSANGKHESNPVQSSPEPQTWVVVQEEFVQVSL